MYIVYIVCIVFILLLCGWIWYHPECILIPLNLLYRCDSSPRTTIYDQDDKKILFPISYELECNWKFIKQEGKKLYSDLDDKSLNYLDLYNINLGTEDKKNWTTIPLRLFGVDYNNNIDLCPRVKEILNKYPEIKTCIFSIMSPGKIINPHVGPYDGLLRYQLALEIPKDGDCYLYVGNDKYYWVEGEGILFDECNLHGAVNNTNEERMVLLIDIERPYNSMLFRILNRVLINILGTVSNKLI